MGGSDMTIIHALIIILALLVCVLILACVLLPDVDDMGDIYEHVRDWLDKLDKEGSMHDCVSVLA